MKKALIIFSTLIFLVVSVTIFGQHRILSQKGEVTITENILLGDASKVEDVVLEMKNHYEHQIFWDTTYTLGKEPKADTIYTFHQVEQAEDIPSVRGVFYFYEDMDHMNWIQSKFYQPEGIERATFELYESLGPSESDERTVYLKDYMEYYTFQVRFDNCVLGENLENAYSFDLSSTELNQEIKEGRTKGIDVSASEQKLQWLKTFQDFFKIPVLEDEVYALAMKKNKNGEVSGWAIGTAGGGTCTGDVDFAQMPDFETNDAFTFEMSSSIEDGDVYFTFYNKSYQGVTMDTSLIPDGYGIYHFPYDAKAIYPEQLQMVYSLEPDIEVYDLVKDDSGEHLLLFTTEEDGVYLSVIEIATMTLKDKVLIDGMEDDEFYGIDCYNIFENYVIVVTYDELVLVGIDADGNYEKEFSISRNQAEELNSDKTGSTMIFALDTAYAWDGEKLVFANYFYNLNGYMGTNFYVGMADKDGLQYFAEYKSSLSSTVSLDEDGYAIYNYAHCRPLEEGMHITITGQQ